MADEIKWQCLKCEGKPEFAHQEFMEHLRQTHNIDPTTAKGTRQATMFLDARGSAGQVYEWTVGGLKFTQTIWMDRKRKGQR
jgi:hypothetical protein